MKNNGIADEMMIIRSTLGVHMCRIVTQSMECRPLKRIIRSVQFKLTELPLRHHSRAP